MEWKDFEPIVVRISRSIKIGNSMTSEDLKQELYIKLIKIMPKLEALPMEDAFKVCTVSLNNHAFDIYRSIMKPKMKNKHVESFVHYDEDLFHSIIGVSIDAINDAENRIMIQDLENYIIEWADCQKPHVRGAFCDWLYRIKNEDSTRIVASVIKKWKMDYPCWYRYLKKLRNFLVEKGYSIDIRLAKNPTLGTA